TIRPPPTSTLFPYTTLFRSLPKHVHALTVARKPRILDAQTSQQYLSSNGNVAPELFKCVAPLTVSGRLVGMVALGRREGDAPYTDRKSTRLNSSHVEISYAV